MDKTKICSKCKEEKFISEFHKDRYTKDGLAYKCKSCRKQYCKDNKKRIVKYKQDYGQKHRKKLSEYQKVYRQDNKDKFTKYNRLYRQNNRSKTNEQSKKSKHKNAKFDVYANQLNWIEKISKSLNGDLLVCCVYCGKFYIPNVIEVSNRIAVLNGKVGGGNRFYCSNACKKACPSYKRIKYWKGQNEERLGTSREVDAWFRQLVLEKDNWTCQKCWASKDKDRELFLHVHHINGVAQHPMLQNDINNAVTLCANCHKEVHKKEGCTYFNYRRLKCTHAV